MARVLCALLLVELAASTARLVSPGPARFAWHPLRTSALGFFTAMRGLPGAMAAHRSLPLNPPAAEFSPGAAAPQAVAVPDYTSLGPVFEPVSNLLSSDICPVEVGPMEVLSTYHPYAHASLLKRPATVTGGSSPPSPPPSAPGLWRRMYAAAAACVAAATARGYRAPGDNVFARAARRSTDRRSGGQAPHREVGATMTTTAGAVMDGMFNGRRVSPTTEPTDEATASSLPQLRLTEPAATPPILASTHRGTAAPTLVKIALPVGMLQGVDDDYLDGQYDLDAQAYAGDAWM